MTRQGFVTVQDKDALFECGLVALFVARGRGAKAAVGDRDSLLSRIPLCC